MQMMTTGSFLSTFPSWVCEGAVSAGTVDVDALLEGSAILRRCIGKDRLDVLERGDTRKMTIA